MRKGEGSGRIRGKESGRCSQCRLRKGAVGRDDRRWVLVGAGVNVITNIMRRLGERLWDEISNSLYKYMNNMIFI